MDPANAFGPSSAGAIPALISTDFKREGSSSTFPVWWKADLFCRAPSIVTDSRLSSIPLTNTFWPIGAPPLAVIEDSPAKTPEIVEGLRSSI
jgi:hypothetical protein